MNAETESCYRINKGSIVYEQMDIEMTVINLEKGHYFIGKGPAIDIFLMLEEPMTISTLVDRTMAVYSVQETIARNEIRPLIDLWSTNGLIGKVENSGDTSAEPAIIAEPKPWETPIFVAFDDMKDLLLLDPIHDTELDQQGWPVAAKPENKG